MKLVSAILAAAAALVVLVFAECVSGISAAKSGWEGDDKCLDTHMPSAELVRRTQVRSAGQVNEDRSETYDTTQQADIQYIEDLMMLRHCRHEACRKSACARAAEIATNGDNCNQLRSACELRKRRIARELVEPVIAEDHKRHGLEEPDIVERPHADGAVDNFETAEKHQAGEDLVKVPIPETSKPQVDGDSIGPRAYHLMTIWDEPIYAGTFAWVYFSQMLAGACVDLEGYGWESLRLYPMDTVYNCVLFDTPGCSNANRAVKLAHGEVGFDIAHFGFFLDGYWWHNVRSVRCQSGP
ncbi:hypothetical protein P171DRAFT_516686 [Karstenula rhodostoma CBS 690.94]|uniref:Cyanovirin-N domain-containing protein n=1 Tax=Karstenula rhodostoma CBS 690.94 TaxID=1392251 RepID=A0A9P4PXZ8_9PLEO|nr:hypothetical protein P171DRAFT_516686 [Karstenula rhodostoma CBS 690.94]